VAGEVLGYKKKKVEADGKRRSTVICVGIDNAQHRMSAHELD
jgi:hypothetical protein